MQVGDSVTLYWLGYDTDGTPLDDSRWSIIHPVTQQDIYTGSFTENVPVEFISPAAGGTGESWYQVFFADGGMSNSSTSQVNIMKAASQTLQINAASGAPWRDNLSSPVLPVNALTIYGPPGADIEVSLSDNTFFNETGTQIWQGRLDIDGIAILYAYRLESPGMSGVSTYLRTDPSVGATASMTFVEYSPGKGSLLGYAVSSGVAANNKTEAGVYFRAAAGTVAARLEIMSGEATIVGYPLSVANILMYDDGNCSAALTDTTAELVQLMLSIPEASGSDVATDASFITFPAA